ncbi:MAG: flippase-like domain-containing protein, partial [Chloroflexi bacterium]|nr:flippase-like domain-containing protein [Chloroflexota bacterium]
MRYLRSPFVWLGLAISLGALFLAFRGLRWSEVGDALRSANYGLLALALPVMILALLARAQRWAVLFYPRRDLRLFNLMGTLNLGYALNNILPLRVGEFARAYVIGEAEQVSTAHALSTIVVERTLDTITVVALLMITVPFVDAPGWVDGAAFLGLGFVALAFLLAVVSAARERALALVVRAARLLPERFREPAERWADAALEGFAVLRRPAVLGQAIAWSAVSWLCSAVLVYVVMRAFALDLPFSAALFVMSATSLGMVVPSSPGYIGVFHAIAIESLVNVFDVPRDPAASFALVLHAILYLVPIVITALFLWRERRTWRQVRLWASGREAPAPA